MQSFSSLLAVAFAAALPLVTALPNVTSIAAEGGCSVYPDYDASSGTTSPFILTTESSGSPVEGYGASYILQNSDSSAIGRINIVDDNMQAKVAIRCNDATGLEAWTGVWSPLNLDEYPYDAELMWGVPGPAVEAYYHDVEGEGSLYLGSQGVTKWGIVKIDKDPAAGVPYAYWNMRLLGPDSQLPGTNQSLLPGEYETFLKI